MDRSAHIVAIEPYSGGSHRAMLESWKAHSRLSWSCLELPDIHWKWRMRHAPLSLAHQFRQRVANASAPVDLIFCSDMLALHEWRGLIGPPASAVPAVTYFHENQFTYPLSDHQRPDFHYGYTNILSAICSDALWFNSQYHLDSFSSAALEFLSRMPDHRHIDEFDVAISRGQVMCPGIDPPFDLPTRATSDSLVIGWVSRWEYDKRPDRFADSIEKLSGAGVPFELILLGERFDQQKEDFVRIQAAASDRIRHAGFVSSNEEYWDRLSQMDVVVSTADHEFYGIAICEAVWAGAIPLVPHRLAYPEVFANVSPIASEYIFHDRNSVDLTNQVQRIMNLTPQKRSEIQQGCKEQLISNRWCEMASRYDDALMKVAGLE